MEKLRRDLDRKYKKDRDQRKEDGFKEVERAFQALKLTPSSERAQKTVRDVELCKK